MELSAIAVFVAGMLTFLSPCVLPVIPIYLSILGGETVDGEAGRLRGFLSTIAFSLGFALVFSLLGLSATTLGRFLAQNKVLFQQVAGIVVLLLGLKFMGYLSIPFPRWSSQRGMGHVRTRFHYLNAFGLGFLFAFAWTPCVGSVLGAVLTYTSVATSSPIEGMAFLFLYSMGFAVPLLVTALVAGPALAALKKAHRFLPVFEKVTGTLLVVTGFLLVTDQWGILDNALGQPPEETPVALAQNPVETWTPHSGEEEETCGGGGAGSTCGFEGQDRFPTFIKFYSPTCPVCLQMIPIVNVLKNECKGKHLGFTEVNVSTPEGKVLARKYRITGIPVFVFEDESGNEVSRLVGYQKLESLEQAASVLIGEECPAYRDVPGL